jgi:hypothetical protein
MQGLGRPKQSMWLWPHNLQFQWAISRFNGPSKYFEGPFQATILSNSLLIPVITVLIPGFQEINFFYHRLILVCGYKYMKTYMLIFVACMTFFLLASGSLLTRITHILYVQRLVAYSRPFWMLSSDFKIGGLTSVKLCIYMYSIMW